MLPVPHSIDRYIVKETLGKGAMGVVYLAMDPTIDRQVAIKAIRDKEFRASPDGDEMEARFRREIHTAGLLTHSNIVTVYDGGKDGDIHWIAMEYVDGPSLAALLKENERIPVQATLDIMIKVCGAIEYAHKKNIIHRDLKPGNILLTGEGDPKLADFGIARIESSTMTQTGVILGTPSYMSPEQVKGNAIDHRSDIFSTGVILYEMLTGRRPFRGNSPTSIMYQIVHEETRPPHIHNSEVPVQLSRIVMKALAKKPSERFQSAGGLEKELQVIKDGGGLETTIRGTEMELDSAEIRAVPDMNTLSRMAYHDDSKQGMSGVTKLLIFLLVFAGITAGAYYAYLFFAGEKEKWERGDQPAAQEIEYLTRAVSIKANVPEATVKVDGETIGQADGGQIMISGEQGTSKTLTIQADCYQPVTRKVTFDSKETSTHEIELQLLEKRITIKSNPEGAEVLVNGETAGEAPLEFTAKCGQEYQFSASKEGFRQSRHSAAWTDLEEGGELTIDLEPLQAGRLLITSPYPVRAFLDDGSELELENGGVSLMPGEYNIRLTNTRVFLNTRRTVTIAEGGTYEINDLPALGELWIREIPAHDGVAIIKGFSGMELPLPVLQREIAAGTYSITIRWPDGEEIQRTVEVKGGQGERAELNVRKGGG